MTVLGPGALLTRDGDYSCSLRTTDAIDDVLAAGYFGRWHKVLGIADTIRVGRFEDGALRELAELLVVEVDGRRVEVIETKERIAVPEPGPQAGPIFAPKSVRV